MVSMTRKMQECFDEMNDPQKFRMFYDLATYLVDSYDKDTGIFPYIDEDMKRLFKDIKNVVTDFDYL